MEQEIAGAKDVFGCADIKGRYESIGEEGEERKSFRCPYEENNMVVWYVNEADAVGKTKSSQFVWSGREVSQKKLNGVIQPQEFVEEALKAFADHYAPENILTLEQAFKETSKGRVVSRHYIFDYGTEMSDANEFERVITVIPRK